jgi:hypothetical protein
MSRPKKTRILIKPGSIREVHDLFSFPAPPFKEASVLAAQNP